jgi:hypothetical protein
MRPMGLGSLFRNAFNFSDWPAKRHKVSSRRASGHELHFGDDGGPIVGATGPDGRVVFISYDGSMPAGFVGAGVTRGCRCEAETVLILTSEEAINLIRSATSTPPAKAEPLNPG